MDAIDCVVVLSFFGFLAFLGYLSYQKSVGNSFVEVPSQLRGYVEVPQSLRGGSFG